MAKKAVKLRPVVYLPDLYRLWNSDRTPQEVHTELGISRAHLMQLVAKHKLGKKPRVRPDPEIDPTPEEIAARAEEVLRAREAKSSVRMTKYGQRKEDMTHWTPPSYRYDTRTGTFQSSN